MTTIDKATAAVKANLDGRGLFFSERGLQLGTPGGSNPWDVPAPLPAPIHEEIARAVLDAIEEKPDAGS